MDAESLLAFQLKKDITYLFKNCLTILDDIRDEHLFMLQKLADELSKDQDLIRAANYMDDNKFALLRKRILDAGNEAIRQADQQIRKFYIDWPAPNDS